MRGTIASMDRSKLRRRLAQDLRRFRRPDGGFLASLDDGAEPEVEPTVVATLALRDSLSRRWLAARMRADGSFNELDGRGDGPATAALGALALEHRGMAGRALRYAISQRGLQPPGAVDPSRRRAWGWTTDARSTVEPTSRVLMAVDVLTPSDRATREEAIRLLRERHCADGGWNYGNASVNDVDLRGYAQTTAIALIGLQGQAPDLVRAGMRFLRRTWQDEPGGLTTAQSLLAFRLYGMESEADDALEALETISTRAAFRAEPVSLAWAVLATGPDGLLDSLRSRA